LSLVSLGWMHFSIRAMERQAQGATLDRLPNFPELAEVHDPERTVMPHVIDDWRPEDPQFWRDTGRRIASATCGSRSRRCCCLRGVDGLVGGRRQAAGDRLRLHQDQLFWLAALPALSGATLRIFYSFMVPIFGGRLWTTLSTARC
jgi:NNP family nitrate/nitrite transporter-like MFS transporter